MAVNELTARYSETDQMGIIHHSVYVNWFEVGRTECIRRFGTSYNEIEKKGFLLPVIQVHLDYKIPARFEDVVQVKTKVSKYNGIRLHFDYEIIRKKDCELLVQGETRHCWTGQNMKPVSLKKHWPQLHEAIQKLAKED